MRGFVIRAAIVALGLWVASAIVPGIEIRSGGALIAAAVLLAVVNAIVRPVLIHLTLPITLLTLGLFLLIINGLMIELVAALLGGFHVDGLWARDPDLDHRQHRRLARQRFHRTERPRGSDRNAPPLTARLHSASTMIVDVPCATMRPLRR